MPKTENGKTENGKRHTTNTDLTDNEDTENNDNHNGATSRSARTTLKNDSVDSVDNEPINRESLDTTKRLTAYYLASYKHFLGIEHPKLKRRQWDRVTQTIMDFSDEHGTDLGDMGNMVKRHFERSMETDYNINHFATEGVLTNLFYEAAY